MIPKEVDVIIVGRLQSPQNTLTSIAQRHDRLCDCRPLAKAVPILEILIIESGLDGRDNPLIATPVLRFCNLMVTSLGHMFPNQVNISVSRIPLLRWDLC